MILKGVFKGFVTELIYTKNFWERDFLIESFLKSFLKLFLLCDGGERVKAKKL